MARIFPARIRVGKGRQRLLDIGIGRRPVDLEQVDMVGLQAAERVFHRAGQPAAQIALLVGVLEPEPGQNRPGRVDARRNMAALLKAALAVFATSGVDAPVREIAKKAGVGVGTVYRHFPQRSDLIKAVVRQEVEACAQAAYTLAAEYDPDEALTLWMQRLANLVTAKRGLAAALHSGDPAYAALPEYVEGWLTDALQGLLDAAAAAGAIRADIPARELLLAAAALGMPRDGDATQGRRMVALLVDGLRYGAAMPRKNPA